MINILDYELTDLPEYHTETVTVSKKHRDYEMIKSLKYHFIELPKFRRQRPDLSNKLEQWLTFIDGMNKELIKMAIKNNKQIKKANEELEYLSGDAELKRLEFLQFKAACDEASRIQYLTEKILQDGLEKGMQKGIAQGMEQGMEKGMEKGINKEKIAIAKKMLLKKMNIDTIIEITGLSKLEIEKIKI